MTSLLTSGNRGDVCWNQNVAHVDKGSHKPSLLFISQKLRGKIKTLSEEESSPPASETFVRDHGCQAVGRGCINTHLHSHFCCHQQPLWNSGLAFVQTQRCLVMKRPNASRWSARGVFLTGPAWLWSRGQSMARSNGASDGEARCNPKHCLL